MKNLLLHIVIIFLLCKNRNRYIKLIFRKKFDFEVIV